MDSKQTQAAAMVVRLVSIAGRSHDDEDDNEEARSKREEDARDERRGAGGGGADRSLAEFRVSW